MSTGEAGQGEGDSPRAAALARSVHDRLMNLVRRSPGRLSYNALLRRYLQERFLYRLSVSPHAERFILKGGLRLIGAGVPWARATKDIDLLGSGDPGAERLAELFRAICRMPGTETDGARFDADSVAAAPIRERDEYGGVRVKLLAFLGNSRETLQVDVGFGDVVTPGPVSMEFPTLLGGMSAPRLAAYNNETTAAEKIHALVLLGQASTRLKDFYDLYRFAMTTAFDGELLARAVQATFARRRTAVEGFEEVFTEEFAQDAGKAQQWRALRRSLGVAATEVPAEFTRVMPVIGRFVRPVLVACQADEAFTGHWNPVAQGWELDTQLSHPAEE